MSILNIKTIIYHMIIDICGGILIAIGIYNFAANAGFPLTGVTGIALIFYHLFKFPIGLVTMILNIPIALFCYRILGKNFFLKSIKTLITTSLIMDFIAPLLPMYSGERILAAICTGIFAGLGFAIIYMNTTSTGGVDFITMSIRVKHPHLSIGRIAFIIDIFVVLLGGAIYRDVDGIIYGILISFILTSVVDKLMYGIDAGKMAMIVTEHGDEIGAMIGKHYGRGATLLKGTGCYSKHDKSIIMCACNNKQMYQIKKLAKQVDPNCFTIIMESNEVLGEGFKTI